MKKTVLTAAIALALTAGVGAPVHAGETKRAQQTEQQSASKSEKRSEIDKFTSAPVEYLFGLLLPAVQKVHDAS